jgi:phage shock protein PspC (stress-responsive transcriptional regulator)
MSMVTALALLFSAVVLVYLAAALLYPEKF